MKPLRVLSLLMRVLAVSIMLMVNEELGKQIYLFTQ